MKQSEDTHPTFQVSNYWKYMCIDLSCYNQFIITELCFLQLLYPAILNEIHSHVPIALCVTVHLTLNDKNTKQQIRIEEKSCWPRKPLEN